MTSDSPLFDFAKDFTDTLHEAAMRRLTARSPRRVSGTVLDSVHHGVVHTEKVPHTMHHVITAACPHPIREKANKGDFYMVAYASIPVEWETKLDSQFRRQYDVTFIGPAGTIQKLPSALNDIDSILGPRMYVGFDWSWLLDSTSKQPTAQYLRDKLIKFVNAARTHIES